MFPLLFLRYYDLKGPFAYNNIGEFGNWTLMGQGTVMRTSLRFTGSLDAKATGLCQRIPTTFENWTFDFNASIHSTRHSNASLLCVSYTSELCPINEEIESGFAVCISGPLPVQQKQNVYVIHGGSRDENYDPICEIEVQKDNIIELTREGSYVTITDKSTGNVCNRKRFRHMPTVGFFSFSIHGESPSFYIDMNEINVKNDSKMIESDGIDFSSMNRKLLTQDRRRRRRLKKARRAKMEAIGLYLHQQLEKNYTLDGDAELSDVLVEISEMRQRATQTLDVSSMNVLIQASAYRGFEAAKEKLDVGAEMLSDTRLALVELVNFIRSELQTIRKESDRAMEELRSEAVYLAREANKGKHPIDLMLVKSAIKSKLAIKEDNIKYIYIGIVITECIGFVLFTLHKRSRTKAFTKID